VRVRLNLLDLLRLNNKPDLALVSQLRQLLLGLIDGLRVLQQVLHLVDPRQSSSGLVKLAQLEDVVGDEGVAICRFLEAIERQLHRCDRFGLHRALCGLLVRLEIAGIRSLT
jgi:hypothetical protein